MVAEGVSDQNNGVCGGGGGGKEGRRRRLVREGEEVAGGATHNSGGAREFCSWRFSKILSWKSFPVQTTSEKPGKLGLV